MRETGATRLAEPPAAAGGLPHSRGKMGWMTVRTVDLDSVVRETLDERGVHYEREREGAYLAKLEGQHKLATMTWLIIGEHSLHVEAFFVRQPDENPGEFYRFLLERNARMYGVHFAVDGLGDVYLVGRLPLSSVTPEEIDRVLGCVLTYSDGNFDQALTLGFATSIRREWEWREKRGESLANLRAFTSVVPGARTSGRSADPERRGR